jgi:intraflagellar transport protein 172
MYFVGEWDKAHKLAMQHLEPNEVTSKYTSHAKDLEEQGKLREAEKLYVYVSEPDMAISMYKKHHQYDQVRKMKLYFILHEKFNRILN